MPGPEAQAAIQAAVTAQIKERLGTLRADREAARKLSFVALAAYYTTVLDETRSEVRRALATFAGTVGERRAAAACGTSQATAHRWIAEGPPSDVRALTAVRQRLDPYMHTLETSWPRASGKSPRAWSESPRFGTQ